MTCQVISEAEIETRGRLGALHASLCSAHKSSSGPGPISTRFITKATSFKADSPRGSALGLGAGGEKGDVGEKRGTGRNSQALEIQRLPGALT